MDTKTLATLTGLNVSDSAFKGWYVFKPVDTSQYSDIEHFLNEVKEVLQNNNIVFKVLDYGIKTEYLWLEDEYLWVLARVFD
jgi:hypothetical protein